MVKEVKVSKLNRIPCPLCFNQGENFNANISGQDAYIESYGELYSGLSKSKWEICSRCGFVFQNPRPSIKNLNAYYLDSKYHSEIQGDKESYIQFAYWYYTEKVEYALNHSRLSSGKVFDIGFGQGGALKIFQDRDWDVYGVEADYQFFRFAKDQLQLKFIQNGILSPDLSLGTKIDLIFSNHAFEHFADLDQVMKGVLKIISPGGYIFTAVPTYYKNRSNLSNLWMNSAHYSLFTYQSLTHLFSKYGFEEVHYSYRGWHKEIDDLWHLAKYTGREVPVETFYENPLKVKKYINVLNPLRSFLFWPFYSHYTFRVKVFYFFLNTIKLFFRSPKLFFLKLGKYFGLSFFLKSKP